MSHEPAIFIADFPNQLIREKVMEKPDEKSDIGPIMYERTMQIYNAHVASRRTFPYPVSKEQDGKELREGVDFEINIENNMAYPLKEALRRKDFPHLIGLENRINAIRFGTVEYWKERCTFLEKTIDETYSTFERDNCRHFYLILVKKEK